MSTVAAACRVGDQRPDRGARAGFGAQQLIEAARRSVARQQLIDLLAGHTTDRGQKDVDDSLAGRAVTRHGLGVTGGGGPPAELRRACNDCVDTLCHCRDRANRTREMLDAV